MPAKYAQIGNKYYAVGEGSQLQQISENDIRGRLGDISGSTYDRFGVARGDWRTLLQNEQFSGGGIQTLDPSSITFGEKGEVLTGGQQLNLAGSAAFVKPGTKVEDFANLPSNPDFSNYLKETGQTYDPTKGFSGNQQIPSTQATQQGQQAGTIDPTTGQPIQQPGAVPGQPGALAVKDGGQVDATQGANPLQVGGKFGTQQFGRLGNDVYEIMSDGSRRKVTEAEFNQKLKAQGLNLDVLPQLDLNDNIADKPAGPPQPDPTQPEKGPTGFLEDYKAIIKELGLTDIKSQFEATKKEYQDLQDKKNAEILEVNDNPWVSEGLRQKQIDKINSKYELKENTLSNQQKLYQSMYEEAIEQAKFLATGVQTDRNKLLDLAQKREEAEAELLKEFAKAAEKKYGAGIIGEYQYAVEQGYKGSFQQYQNEDVNRKATVAAAGAPKPLAGDTSKVFAIAQTIVPEINKLKDAFRTNFKGALRGYVSGTDRELVKLIDNVADKVGRLRSGGAVNVDEEARFKRQIASFADLFFANSEDAIAALDGILSEANLVSQGIDPSGVRTTNTQPKSIIDLSGLNFKFK